MKILSTSGKSGQFVNKIIYSETELRKNNVLGWILHKENKKEDN